MEQGVDLQVTTGRIAVSLPANLHAADVPRIRRAAALVAESTAEAGGDDLRPLSVALVLTEGMLRVHVPAHLDDAGKKTLASALRLFTSSAKNFGGDPDAPDAAETAAEGNGASAFPGPLAILSSDNPTAATA